MKPFLPWACVVFLACALSGADSPLVHGTASWYGEAHRGKLMANGQPFDPDQFSAASWFYPLGTRLRVTHSSAGETRSVVVTVTDRGPARRLVKTGRIIDLSRATFAALAPLEIGLAEVTVQPVNEEDPRAEPAVETPRPLSAQ